jgi:hypothetical protein
LFVILYADDTIILSESKENMQSSLDIFHSYCEMWNLRVNANKTKVMIFSKRKVRQNIEYYLNGQKQEIIDTFSYLGVLFKYKMKNIE